MTFRLDISSAEYKTLVEWANLDGHKSVSDLITIITRGAVFNYAMGIKTEV